MTDKEKEAIEDFKLQIEQEKEELPYSEESLKNKKTILNLIQTQQEEIEDCKKCVLRDEVHNYIEEIEKKDTLINTMQAEFERLEDLEDNTDMLKLELQKKDKIIDEMAEQIFYWQDDKLPLGYSIKEVKEYFINKVEKESKDESN